MAPNVRLLAEDYNDRGGWALPLGWQLPLLLPLNARENYADQVETLDVIVPGSYSMMPEVYLTGWKLVGVGEADIDWNVAAAIGYRFNDQISAVAGYRALGVDYSDDDGFVFDVVQQGPILGLVVRFQCRKDPNKLRDSSWPLRKPFQPPAAGLHADQTGRQLGEERQNLRSPQSFVNDNVARRVDGMNLKNTLGQIKAHGGNLHGGWLLSLGLHDSKPILARRCREREPSTSSAFKRRS